MNGALRTISLVCMGFLVVLVIGCTNYQSAASEVIANVQKDVPFTIIVPAYFPSDVRPVPSQISGPSTNDITNSVGVGITYYGKSDNKMIIVDEENINIDMLPAGPYDTFNINEVAVLSQETSMASATKIYYGLLYSWNRNGVNFQVRIFGYDQNEGRKIIESMIK